MNDFLNAGQQGWIEWENKSRNTIDKITQDGVQPSGRLCKVWKHTTVNIDIILPKNKYKCEYYNNSVVE